MKLNKNTIIVGGGSTGFVQTMASFFHERNIVVVDDKKNVFENPSFEIKDYAVRDYSINHISGKPIKVRKEGNTHLRPKKKKRK